MTSTTLVARLPESSRPRAATETLARARIAAAAAFLCGVLLALLGFAWDVQWHLAVGRDRPLTPPHLLLLSGIALSGLLALAGVLSGTLAARARPRPAPAPDDAVQLGATTFLGVFRAPLGVYVAGVGALLSAMAFPLDDYWHRLYGIDARSMGPHDAMCKGKLERAAHVVRTGQRTNASAATKGTTTIPYRPDPKKTA